MSNRTPLKTRVQSPGHHLLTPNDDDYERAQVRKARAAALRRKSGIGAEIAAAGSGQATPSQDDIGVLSREHILELHNNCIKLAAENVRVHLAHTLAISFILRLQLLEGASVSSCHSDDCVRSCKFFILSRAFVNCECVQCLYFASRRVCKTLFLWL